jgi:hypothetical protein
MPRDRSPEAARKRLEDAHGLWLQTLESYPDADAFVTNVNALISGLSTVLLRGDLGPSYHYSTRSVNSTPASGLGTTVDVG